MREGKVKDLRCGLTGFYEFKYHYGGMRSSGHEMQISADKYLKATT